MPSDVSGVSTRRRRLKQANKQYVQNNVSELFLGTWRATADNARLYFEDDQDSKRIGAWCANDRDNQWIKVDLGKTKRIRAIATQGKKSNSQ